MSIIGNNVFVKREKVLDEVEKGEQLAREQRIKQLTDFIGGFEKWSLLNEDCRLHIVQFLDYKSRCQLERCSKQDQATVKRTPICLHRVMITEYEKSSYGNPFDKVKVDFNFGKRTRDYHFEFFQKGADTIRGWFNDGNMRWSRSEAFIIKDSNYYEEAVKFVEGLLKKGNFEVEDFSVNTSKCLWETSRIRPMSFCKEVLIWVNSVQQLDWWLSKLPENMKNLGLHSAENLTELAFPFESLDVPQVRTVHSLSIFEEIRCTDEQFLSFTNKSMLFLEIGISDEAINEFIKRWMNGNCFKGFEVVRLPSMEHIRRKLDVILDGIKATYWDEDFNKEAGFFCSEFRKRSMGGDNYEIASRVDPYESLTLNIVEDDINIYHTGKRVTRNGEDCKEYFAPRGFW